MVGAVRTFQNAQDVFDDCACDVLHINRSDGRCLDILDHAGPLTAGELARRADLSTAAITTLVDRLERGGYVTRVRDTVDRRRVLITVTDGARAKCDVIWGPVASAGDAFLKEFSDDELTTVLRFLQGGEALMTMALDQLKELTPDRLGEPAPSPAPTGKIGV